VKLRALFVKSRALLAKFRALFAELRAHLVEITKQRSTRLLGLYYSLQHVMVQVSFAQEVQVSFAQET